MSSFKFEAWPTEYRTITQYFGVNPDNYAQFGLPGHDGIDIHAPSGTKVFAVAPGQIRLTHTIGLDHNYGIHVRISHVDGYETIYAHLKEVRVKNGDIVAAGDLIGLADDTGNSFGAHLHLTLKHHGRPTPGWPRDIVDPTPFILPLIAWRRPVGPFLEGFVQSVGIMVIGDLAQVSAGGSYLRQAADADAAPLGIIPGGTIVIVGSETKSGFRSAKVSIKALDDSSSTTAPPVGSNAIEGWGRESYVVVNDGQGYVDQFGLSLRMAPLRNAAVVGRVRGGSTVAVLGADENGYLPLRVWRADFEGQVTLPGKSESFRNAAIQTPANALLAWAWTRYLTIKDTEARPGYFGVSLRVAPHGSAERIGIARGGATLTVAGKARGDYTPVFVQRADILELVPVVPNVEVADPLDAPDAGELAGTPGWVLSAEISVIGEIVIAGSFGVNLCDAPSRAARKIGYVPPGARMALDGTPTGEFTPVRVSEDVLQPPLPETDEPRPDPDPTPLGNARIGLHASADPEIVDAEVAEFAAMRPGMIKLLSFHNPTGVAKLAAAHPRVRWVVRAFLDFGGRPLTPQQFFDFTISDMHRTLDLLRGRDVVIELHNEPNLVMEGLGPAWADGAGFARWWLELLYLYRRELPDYRYLYPGLSPGADIYNVKHDHVRFVEASRDAVTAADGIAVHLYWSRYYAMEKALHVLDDYISRFRYKQIWVTEASNNKGGTEPAEKARQYLTFWHELQKRPTVQGVTYFVASAINPLFAEEVFLGRGMAEIIGKR